MPFTDSGKNEMLDASTITHVAAFEGDPTGAGVELDRQAITHAAASGGARDSTTQPVFAIDAGETVNYIGFFDAPSDGTLKAYKAVTPEGPYGAAGTYQLTDSDLDLNG